MSSTQQITPLKCAVKFKPPTLVLFYRVTSAGRTRRRSMPLRGFRSDTDVKVYAGSLLKSKRHASYIQSIPETQVEALLQRVKNAHNTQPAGPNEQGPPPSRLPPLQKLPPLNLAAFSPPPLITGATSHEHSTSQTSKVVPKANDESAAIITPPIGFSSVNEPASLMTGVPPVKEPLTTEIPPVKEPLMVPPTEPLMTGVPPTEPLMTGVPPTNEPSDYSDDFNSEGAVTPLGDQSLSLAVEELCNVSLSGKEDSDSLGGEDLASFSPTELLTRKNSPDKNRTNGQLDDYQDNVTGHQDNMTDHQDNVTGHQDNMTVHQDNVTGHQDNMTVHQDNMTGHQDNVTGHQDNVTRQHQDNVTGYRDGSNENLNKASDDHLERRKAEMDVLFEANRRRPGDPDYEYDKEVEFNARDEISLNSWDSDLSDDEHKLETGFDFNSDEESDLEF